MYIMYVYNVKFKTAFKNYLKSNGPAKSWSNRPVKCYECRPFYSNKVKLLKYSQGKTLSDCR